MMNKTAVTVIISAVTFVVGAACGAFGGWFVAKKEYEKLRHEELDEVRELYFGEGGEGSKYFKGIVGAPKVETVIDASGAKTEASKDVIDTPADALFYQKDSILISQEEYDDPVPPDSDIRDGAMYRYVISSGVLENLTYGYTVDDPCALLGKDAIQEIVRIGFVGQPQVVNILNRISGRRFQVEVHHDDLDVED